MTHDDVQDWLERYVDASRGRVGGHYVVLPIAPAAANHLNGTFVLGHRYQPSEEGLFMHPSAMRLSASLGLAVAVAMAAAGVAVANVSFDPATGTGYVDKSDVQAAFGWNEGTFQANAGRLSFHAASYTSWSWECVIGGVPATITADLESGWVVASEVVATPGQRRSASGFNLTGLGAPLSSPSDTNPASCPEGDPTNVSSSTTDVLYVDLRSRSEVLWTS